MIIIFPFSLDAQGFEYVKYRSTVAQWAPLFGKTAFIFSVSLPDPNQVGSIKCGFENENYLLQQRRTLRPTIETPYASRAKVLWAKFGMAIGVMLRNVTFGDSRKYFKCLMMYSGLPYESGKYLSIVYGKFYL